MVVGGRFPVNRTLRGGDYYSGECTETHQKDGAGRYTWANGDVYEGQYVREKREGTGRLSRPGEGEEYVGAWLADQRHGRGRLTTADGTVFEGEWFQDRLVHATRTDQDGSRYEGQFQDGLRHGHGAASLADGTTYEGAFVEDVYHGDGTLRYGPHDAPQQQTCVKSFQGEFVRGRPHGVGTVVYYDGGKYVGNVVNCRRDGIGRFVSHECDIYHGSWAGDRREGHGECEWANGDRFVGQWSEDQRHGTGLQEKRGHWTYDGPWERGCRHGAGGVLSTAAGDVFHGTWVKEALHGEGSHTNQRTGESYMGQYSRGLRSGVGSATLRSSDKYQGQWEAGVIAGEGCLVRAASGDTYQGQFQAGEPHGQARVTYGGSGDTYVGALSRGRRHGHGVHVSAKRDGEVYEGDFVEDARSGEGVLTSGDGRHVWRGRWQRGHLCGEGSYRCPEYAYYGGWLDGKRHGDGHCEFVGGESYEGQWRADSQHGHGLYRGAANCGEGAAAASSSSTVAEAVGGGRGGGGAAAAVGSGAGGGGGEAGRSSSSTSGALVERYEGEWVAGQREGQGEWLDGKGTTFKGTFVAGQLHGPGEARLPNSDVYRGEWRKGRRHGTGVIRFWDGAQIEGEWLDDQLHGQGVHVSASGVRKELGRDAAIKPRAGRLDSLLDAELPRAFQSAADLASGGGQETSPPLSTPPRRRGGHPSTAPRSPPASAMRPCQRDTATKTLEGDRPGQQRRSRQEQTQQHQQRTPQQQLQQEQQQRQPPRLRSQSSGSVLAQDSKVSDFDAFMRRVEEQEQKEQGRFADSKAARSQVADEPKRYQGHGVPDGDCDPAAKLARGLAGDNWRLRGELEQAKRDLEELRQKLAMACNAEAPGPQLSCTPHSGTASPEFDGRPACEGSRPGSGVGDRLMRSSASSSAAEKVEEGLLPSAAAAVRHRHAWEVEGEPYIESPADEEANWGVDEASAQDLSVLCSCIAAGGRGIGELGEELASVPCGSLRELALRRMLKQANAGLLREGQHLRSLLGTTPARAAGIAPRADGSQGDVGREWGGSPSAGSSGGGGSPLALPVGQPAG